MGEKKSFLLYRDMGQHIQLLPDKEAGKLFKSLFAYADGAAPVKISPAADMAFSFIAAQMRRDASKYAETCEMRSLAGKKGAEVKYAKALANVANASFAKQKVANVANASFAKQDLAKLADKDTDTENEKDTEKDIYSKLSGKPDDGFFPGEVLAYLNTATGKHFRPDGKAAARLISARQAEGFTLADFRAVIDCKAAQWKGTDMDRYLRPETLFSTKFGSYLQEVQPEKPAADALGWGLVNLEEVPFDD